MWHAEEWRGIRAEVRQKNSKKGRDGLEMWHAREWRRIRTERICAVMFSRNTLRNRLRVMGFVITIHVELRKNLVRRPI